MKEFAKRSLVMDRADGLRYWDVNGKEYLDALSGIYVVSVRHNNRRVKQAIKDQLDRLAFSPVMHGTNPIAVQLANLLVKLAPGDLNTVKFGTSGSRNDRGRYQDGQTVPSTNREPAEVQNHLALFELAWFHNGLTVSRWP